jgi:protease-4
METLHQMIQAISDADNVNGVVLVLRNLSTGIATLQSLRSAIGRLQAAGKEVVVFTPILDLAHYFVAVAADRIVIPPSAMFDVVGLHADAVFLKDALDRLGIQAEVVQISPYKAGFDTLSKSEMSPEYREQFDWILDDTFDLLLEAIAHGRGKSKVQVRELIDAAPYTAKVALESGLVDDVAYEDSLAYLLADNGGSESEESSDITKTESLVDDKNAEAIKPKAKMATWSRARRIMLERYRRRLKHTIGVISIEGAITPGPSRQPPINLPIPFPYVGSSTAGEETVVQQLRLAERDKRIAAVILHIDSPGGAHIASDLIWRQVFTIAKKKPIVCFFGNVAASGGYYLSAPSAHIVAHESSITGSIGVYSAHISSSDLYHKLGINRVILSRGERALLHSDAFPLSDDEREILWEGIVNVYDQFKQVVTDGRDLERDQLDQIGGGRVWTGRQALDHGLIDSHGDFIAAVEKAAELAKLPIDDDHRVEVINIYPRARSYLLPGPFEPVQELIDSYSLDQLIELYSRPALIMPFEIKVW